MAPTVMMTVGALFRSQKNVVFSLKRLQKLNKYVFLVH